MPVESLPPTFHLSKKRSASCMDELARTKWNVRKPSIISPPVPCIVFGLFPHFVTACTSTFGVGCRATAKRIGRLFPRPSADRPNAKKRRGGASQHRRCGAIGRLAPHLSAIFAFAVSPWFTGNAKKICQDLDAVKKILFPGMCSQGVDLFTN